MNKQALEVARNGQAPLPRYTPDQVDLIKRQICKGSTDDQLKLFMYQCERTGLDPFVRQIYAVMRGNAMTIQTSIDGFRLIAERTGKYRGQVGPYWCGKDGQWLDVWTSNEAPAASRVGILKLDCPEPFWGVARFDAYAQKYQGKLSNMWAQMGDVMIAKCAEALGLRKAFPQELSGLYSGDEMEQAEVPQKSAHKARKDGDWETLKAEIAACQSVFELKAWGNTSRERVHQLPDSWQAHLREAYELRMGEIEEGVTEEGSPLKKQLKQSIIEHDAEEAEEPADY